MTAPDTADLIKRLEIRMDIIGSDVVTLAKDEAEALLSAARQAERLRDALQTLVDVLDAPVLDHDAVEPSYRKARAALQSETPHVK
jgi:hypothetical protein